MAKSNTMTILKKQHELMQTPTILCVHIYLFIVFKTVIIY